MYLTTPIPTSMNPISDGMLFRIWCICCKPNYVHYRNYAIV